MAGSRFDLTGKVALVTGGNGGIGLGMAEALAEAGADICVWGRNEEKNKAAEEKLNQYGTKVLVQKCDVGDEGEIDKSFAQAVEELGHIDSCFANAAIGGSGTLFHQTSLADWRKVHNVNMEGVFLTFRAAIRHMIEKEIRGSLVATSSLSAVSGAPRSVNYASTKGGILSLVYALASGYARYGIRANTIVPGWIETDMTSGITSQPSFINSVQKRIPQRRWGQPYDFGALAVYFASDASEYHSGDTVTIDGGYIRF
jgi:NAD(P)-dependent dehydrogenase (short-subunit alcohol dehydrogenase family)